MYEQYHGTREQCMNSTFCLLHSKFMCMNSMGYCSYTLKKKKKKQTLNLKCGSKQILRCGLDQAYLCLRFTLSRFFLFFFFLLEVGFTWGIDLPVGTVHSARDLLAFWTSTHWSEMALFVGPMHCSRDPQTSFFTQTLITNGSHSTIHIFKNYFATIFSVFSKISCIQTDLKKGSNKR